MHKTLKPIKPLLPSDSALLASQFRLDMMKQLMEQLKLAPTFIPKLAELNSIYDKTKRAAKKKETRILPKKFIIILRKRFSSLDAYIIKFEVSLSLK